MDRCADVREREELGFDKRIRRQQIFLRALLAQSFDFCSLVNDPELVRLSDAAALKELAAVNSSWRMQTFADVRYHKIGLKSVLVEAEEAQGALVATLLSWLCGTHRGRLSRRFCPCRLKSSPWKWWS